MIKYDINNLTERFQYIYNKFKREYILMSSTKVVPERECRVVFLGESVLFLDTVQLIIRKLKRRQLL